METKYNIWDIISMKTYRYTLIAPIVAIRDYGEFYEYVVYGSDMWFMESEIIGRVDAKWNIVF